MKCGLNNSLSFEFRGKSGNDPMKNGQLNLGVVTPPDKLPNGSLSRSVSSYELPKTSLGAIEEPKTSKAGSLSANSAFLALGLAVFSVIPFVRKH